MKALVRCSGMVGLAATAMGLQSPEKLNFMMERKNKCRVVTA